MGVNSLPMTVTQQRRRLRFEPGPFCTEMAYYVLMCR